MILLCTPERAEALCCMQGYFTDPDWLPPCDFAQTAQITMIDEEEYNHYRDLELQDAEITVPEPEPEPDPLPDSWQQEEDIEVLRSLVLACLESRRRAAVDAGFVCHGKEYAYTYAERQTLAEIAAMIMQGLEQYPYHAKDEPSTFYDASLLWEIYCAGKQHQEYHSAYAQSAANWIASMTTKDELWNFVYGMEIPHAYKTEMLVELEENGLNLPVLGVNEILNTILDLQEE